MWYKNDKNKGNAIPNTTPIFVTFTRHGTIYFFTKNCWKKIIFKIGRKLLGLLYISFSRDTEHMSLLVLNKKSGLKTSYFFLLHWRKKTVIRS